MAVLLLTAGSPNNLLLTNGDDLLLEDESPVGAGVAGPAGCTIHVEFSPTTRPLDGPEWVDITEHVRFSPGVVIKRGRSSELDQFTAGSLSLVLNNSARLFDPSYAAGIYFGDLKPMRRIRVVVGLSGVDYSLFMGFILGWPQEYDLSDNVAVVPIQARDGFEILANVNATDNYFILDDATFGRLDLNRLGGDGVEVAESLSGERVETVLNVVDWPIGERDIDTGLALFSADAMSGSALSYLRRAEVSEDGFFFIAKDGQATWRDRASRWTNTRMTSTQFTLSDDGADVPYSQVATRFDRDFVVNDVTRAREGGEDQFASDSDSIVEYGRRKDSETNLLVANDAEAKSRAEYKVARYAEPMLRPEPVNVPVMGIPAASRSARFADLLDAELLDRVVLERRPMGGAVVTSTGLVQSLEHRFDTKTWDTAVTLSPGDIDDTQYLILDDVSDGLLNTAVLAY